MSDKLITMKEYNGSSYDTLYPKNISGQVILDSTALSILNLPANSTVNDGFNHLANGGAFNVGDILVTSRTDMDDTWLLCNGDTFDSSEYPELENVLSKSVSVLDSSRWSTTTTSVITMYTRDPSYAKHQGQLYYCGGRYFCASYPQSDDTKLFYVSSDGKSWSRWLVPSNSSYFIRTICDVGGVAYATIRYGSGSSYLYSIDNNNSITQVLDNTYSFDAMCEYDGKILSSYNGISLIDPVNKSVMQLTSRSLSGNIWYHVGDMIYANKQVFNPQTKVISTISTDVEWRGGTTWFNDVAFGYKNGYYYMSGCIYSYNSAAKLTSRNILLKSSDAINFTTIYEYNGSSAFFMFIINDNLLIGPNVYELTNNGAQLSSSANTYYCNAVAVNDVDSLSEKVMINLNSSASTINIFNSSANKIPTYSPADGLCAYIKAKK